MDGVAGPLRHLVRAAMRRVRGDAGTALVEFIFVGLILLVPLVYLVIALASIERNTYGATEAAREAGRTFARTGDASAAAYAARIALEDQHAGSSDLALGATEVGGSCEGSMTALDPSLLAPGNSFQMCVVRSMTVPGIPRFLDPGRNTVTGEFVVHVDDYATGAPAHEASTGHNG
ncbi:MAG: hypothetical protein ACR2F6_02175 [Mycobacteriales bacterium]